MFLNHWPLGDVAVILSMIFKFIRQNSSIGSSCEIVLRWMPTKPHLWLVNIGSGNGLVPDGTKPLHELMLTQFAPYGVTRPQWVNLLKLNKGHHHMYKIQSSHFAPNNIWYTKLPWCSQTSVSEWVNQSCFISLHCRSASTSQLFNTGDSLSFLFAINSSPHSAAYMRQWICSALVQIMVGCLFSAKLLPKTMQGFYQLGP